MGSPLSCAHSASSPGVSAEGEGEPGFLLPPASNGEVPSLSLPEWVTGNHYRCNGLNNYRTIHILGELWKLQFLNKEFASPKVQNFCVLNCWYYVLIILLMLVVSRVASFLSIGNLCLLCQPC